MKRKLNIFTFLIICLSIFSLVGCGKNNTYKITYIIDGQVLKEETANIGEQHKLFNVADSDFSGWYTDFKYTYGPFETYLGNGEDVTLYGTLNEIKEYTSKDIKDIKDRIAALDDTVTFDNRVLISEIYLEYIYIPDDLQEEVTNKDKLIALYEDVKKMNGEILKVVEDSFKKITSESYESIDAIKETRRLFDTLPDDLKKEFKELKELENYELKLKENKIANVIISIEDLKYKINYSDIERVNEIKNLYQSLSDSDKDKVYNSTILDDLINQVNELNSQEIIYNLGDGKYKSIKEMKDAFFGDYYKFLVEKCHSTINDVKKIDDISKHKEYFANQKESNLLDSQSGDKFIGYCIYNNIHVDLIKFLIGRYYTYSNDSNYLFSNNSKAFDYFFNAFDKLEKEESPFGIVKIENDKASYEYAIFDGFTKNGKVYTANWSDDNSDYADGVYLSGLLDMVIECNEKDEKTFSYYDSLINDVSDNARSYIDSYYDYVLYKYELRTKDVKDSATNTDIILSSSKAFSDKKSKLHYEQYNLRDDVNPSPEDASQYRTLFLCCSHFCQAAYHYAFGYTIYEDYYVSSEKWTDYMTANYGKKEDIVLFLDCTKYVTDAEQEEGIKLIQDTLLPGDIIVYRQGETRGSSGHCMIYYGDKKLIHCTGASYKVTSSSDPTQFYDHVNNKEKTLGGVAFDSWDILFNKTSARYLFKPDGSNKKFTVGIIRPLVYDLEPTEEARNRYAFPDLQFEKASTITPYKSIHLGEEATYTINITNEGTNKISNVYVSEELPEGCEFVSATEGGIYNKTTNKIVWEIPSVIPYRVSTVSYTLKLKEDKELLGKKLVDDKTYVNGIRTNIITNFIASNFNQEDFVGFSESKIGEAYETTMDLVRDVYMKVGMNVLQDYNTKLQKTNYTDDVEWMLDTTMNKADIDFESPMYPLTILYNGYDTYNSSNEALVNNERCKLARVDYFETGDVILIYNTYKTNEYKAYLFVNENMILGINAGGIVANVYNNKTDVAKFIETLIAYESFMVIRPSLEVK